MLKISSRNTRTRCEICLKLTVKTVERWRPSTVGGYRSITRVSDKYLPAQIQQ